MNTKIFLCNILALFLLVGCSNDDEYESLGNNTQTGKQDSTSTSTLPEGFFEVVFATSTFDMDAAVGGSDARVQHIRYIIYKSTGEFVKEKTVLIPSQGTPTWPLAVVRDTLPKGTYKAVFLGNIEKTLFPYTSNGVGGNYAEVLTNYKGLYADARIVLPNREFSANTEYYWGNVNFSDTNSSPTILLQRIIGSLKLHREFVTTNDAVNKLVQNILSQINYKNLIQTALTGTLADHSDGLLYQVLRPILVNNLTLALAIAVDPLLNLLITALITPVTDALYNQLASSLISQIELALAANATGNEGGLAYLGRILNPWAYGNGTIVTINNFTKTTDFDLNVKDYFTGDNKFKYDFITDAGGTVNEKYIAIKGFNAAYDVRKIDVLAQGLVAGVIVDQIIGNDLLLPGAFMDIHDPIVESDPKNNYRYQATYSFLDLKLKSYTQQTDGNHRLTLTVKLGNIANIDGILTTVISDLRKLPVVGLIVGLLTDALFAPIKVLIKNVTISVPLNLPLLGVDNLTLSGSWTAPTRY